MSSGRPGDLGLSLLAENSRGAFLEVVCARSQHTLVPSCSG